MSMPHNETIAEAVSLIIKLTAPDVQRSVEALLGNVVNAAYYAGQQDGINSAAKVISA